MQALWNPGVQISLALPVSATADSPLLRLCASIGLLTIHGALDAARRPTLMSVSRRCRPSTNPPRQRCESNPAQVYAAQQHQLSNPSNHSPCP